MTLLTLSFIVYLILLLPSTQLVFTFIDDSKCPSSWMSSGDVCIKPFLRPLTSLEAERKCQSEGGVLLDCDRAGVVDDVADILRGFYENRLFESTWLVSRRVGEAPRAIARSEQSQYKLIDVPSSAVFPFICSLTEIGKRSLLIQQSFLNSGAPHFVSSSPSEVFFYSRADSDYVVLPCPVDGNPKPNITWYKNNIDVVTPSDSTVPYLLSGGSLLVPADNSLAYSSFHCTAKNHLGEVKGTQILLKPAFLESFNPHRTSVVPLYNGGAKLECEAPNHQPKSYSYLWLYDSSTERIFPNSNRTLVSLDGTLYFSYVTKQDETSYACSLSLSYTQSGHYGPFFRFHVPVSQIEPFAPRLDTSQPQVFPESPSLGSIVYLECFAYGNPVPIYKWSRVDGKPINKNSVLMNYGRVLRIDSVELNDSGRYKCSAANSHGIASREVTLTLKSPPSIVIPLSDRHVATESDIVVECPLSSMDFHSSVEWFKDAKPIVPILMPSEQRNRFRVDNNRLLIKSTTTFDSGVYQCIASNEVGVASSSAYILVRNSAPIFPRQSMPRKIFAVNGSSLSIPCFYHASPRGHNRWADASGTKLPHKGRVRDRNGVLVIENVLHDDAGYFFCTAHNRYGKAHSQVELIVLDKAQVQLRSAIPPQAAEDTINITCSVEIDCEEDSECPEALFQWTFDNRSVNFIPGLHLKTKVSSLTKTVRRPQRVACYSLYGEDSIDLSPRSNLPTPLSLKVEQDQQTVRLMWRRSINTHRDTRNHAVNGESDSPGGYLVELRTKDDRQWRAAPQRMIAESESHSFTLSDLTPNTLYQFRVRTVDAFTMGEPSSPSTWVKTPPAAPSETIDGLRWKSLDNNTIFVEWNPVETSHQSGDHLRYRLSWSMEDSDQTEDAKTPERKFLAHHIDTKSPQAIVKLNTSRDCRMLVLSVRPMNDQGAGLISTDTVAFVHRNVEPRHVSFVNASALNSTHALFSWEWEEENECGRAHAIQLSCSSTDNQSHDVTVLAEFSEWILGELNASTKYQCFLTPVDDEGNYGVASKPVTIITKQKPPTNAPIIKKISLKPTNNDVGYTTIIEWSAIEFPHTNWTDTVIGYKIFVYVSETASEAVELTMPISDLSNPRQPSARLDGLKLMYMYTIQVAGYNSGGLGPLSASRTIRLGPRSSLDDDSSSMAYHLHPAWTSFICLVIIFRL